MSFPFFFPKRFSNISPRGSSWRICRFSSLSVSLNGGAPGPNRTRFGLFLSKELRFVSTPTSSFLNRLYSNHSPLNLLSEKRNRSYSNARVAQSRIFPFLAALAIPGRYRRLRSISCCLFVSISGSMGTRYDCSISLSCPGGHFTVLVTLTASCVFP